MTPEKMTNAELADRLDEWAYASTTKEAIKRLRAMPEPPKPEIWYRTKDDPEMIYTTFEGAVNSTGEPTMLHTADEIEKIEVRIVA